MTDADRRLEWVWQARAGVAAARGALARPSPSALDGLLSECEHAAALLRAVQREVKTVPAVEAPGLRAALACLRLELGRARSLLDTAAAWHLGWARLLQAAVAGYTARGELAAPPAARSLLLEA